MSDETIKDTIKKIFVNPEVSQRAVDLLVPSKNKPQGWSRRSNAPYFKEEYALQMKLELDKMMVDQQDRVYHYDKWPHMTPNSVYLRINQSLRYLTTFLDPNGIYARFLQSVSVKRKRGYGVEMKFISHLLGTNEFSPQSVVPSAETPRWKQRIEEWLERSEPGSEPLIIENLMLTLEEVRALKLEFAGLQTVQHSITATTIKLIKVDL